MSEISTVYPREVICGECGTAMLLTWHNPMELSQGGDAIYEHPDRHCVLKGKRLKATGLTVFVIKDEWEE